MRCVTRSSRDRNTIRIRRGVRIRICVQVVFGMTDLTVIWKSVTCGESSHHCPFRAQ